MAAVEPTRRSTFLEFEHVRDFLGTPSLALSVFTDALAAEGTLLDQLLESNVIDEATICTAVKAAESTSRQLQAQVLLREIAQCKEWPVANFLFFLCTRQPGLLNIIETDLLQRVQRALESDLNVLSDLFPELSSDTGEAGSALRDFAQARENERPINVICVGKAGAGKSTLGNALLGDQIENRAATGRGGQCVTKSVEKIKYAGLDQPFVYWDTPGIMADADAQTEFEEMAREVMEKGQDVDLFILCAPAHEGRDHPDNKSIVQSLTSALGSKVWSHAVIVFSQANLVVDPDHKHTTAEYFHRECITEMKLRYRGLLVEAGGLSPKEAEAVPCVPVGRNADPYLPDGTNWKKEFWMTCIGRISVDVRGVFVACGVRDPARFEEGFEGVDRIRMALGMSAAGGSAGGAILGAGIAIALQLRKAGPRAATAAATALCATSETAIGAAMGAVAIGGLAVGAVYFAYKLHERYQKKEK